MKTDRKSRSSRFAPFLTSLALTCALAAGNAGATIPVADVANGAAHWTNSISTYLSKIEDVVEHGLTYKREIDRVTDLATQASSLISTLTTMPMQDPKPRDPNYGMEQCEPGFSGGFSLSDIFGLVAPDLMTKSIPEQQQMICKQRQRLKNERHNENVRITKVIKDRMKEIDDLAGTMSSSDTTGQTATNLNKGTLLLNKLISEIQYSNTIVRVYDNSIASLDDDDKALAKQALSGPKKGLAASLLSTAVQTASLCAGLMVAKSDGSDFSCGL
jgi:hypothetical protein